MVHRKLLSTALSVHRKVVLANAGNDVREVHRRDGLQFGQHVGSEVLANSDLEANDVLTHDVVYHVPEVEGNVWL